MWTKRWKACLILIFKVWGVFSLRCQKSYHRDDEIGSAADRTPSARTRFGARTLKRCPHQGPPTQKKKQLGIRLLAGRLTSRLLKQLFNPSISSLVKHDCRRESCTSKNKISSWRNPGFFFDFHFYFVFPFFAVEEVSQGTNRNHGPSVKRDSAHSDRTTASQVFIVRDPCTKLWL